MAVTANVSVKVNFASDVLFNQEFAIAANAASPGRIVGITLASGDNSIGLPTSSTTVGIVLLPPSTNTATLTLKGNAGDTGVVLHKTNPTFISVNAGSQANIIVNASAGVTIRYILV